MVLKRRFFKRFSLLIPAGARDFLTKPFGIPEVSMHIKNMLEVGLLYNETQNYKNDLEQKYQPCSLDLTAAKLKLENEISQRKNLEEELRQYKK